MNRMLIGLLIALAACDPIDNEPIENAPPPIESSARASIGSAAPEFVLPTTDGGLVTLSDFAGQAVVLEWFNPGCPFVKDVYGSDKMTDIANKWTAQGVVWLTINSNAPGKNGAGRGTNQRAADKWDIGRPILLDETGAVGRAYGAKTTPHMYVIAPDGTLAFAGAFSNAPLGSVTGGSETNYVDAALAEITAGQPVTDARPKPWGCSVKYGA